MSALLQSLAVDGAQLPGLRDEVWRSVPLRALERRAFERQPVSPADWPHAAIAHVPSPRVVFVNGRFDAAASDPGPLADQLRIEPAEADSAHPDDVFVAAGRLHARSGLQLDIADASDAGTLHLVQIGVPGDADALWHLRHRIRLGAGARLRLVEHQLSTAPHAHFDNSHCTLVLDAASELQHLRIQSDAPASTRILHTQARLATGARYRRLDLELGAGLSRHMLHVTLAGEQADVVANGVQLATGRSHHDTRLQVAHAAPGAQCRMEWRALAADHARTVFHGGIRIDAGADGSVATLSQRNLLLSAQAQCSAQPVLEIHADEVQAAHGTTVGQLDTNALFYLRARGIPEADARRLLTSAFCRDVLDVLDDDALLAAADSVLQRALQPIHVP